MSTPFAAPPRLPEPERERWCALRAGIQNVWEYDDRRFVFRRGRLLLRGQNEAGKTKAMELLFPFLLDAELSPQRLDPFGTTSRPMRWNLVNEADPDVQQRIGYLWLELGRVEGGKKTFCTLGAGLKARRGSPDVDAWFFVTSQRPDQDVRFVVDGRPLARGELVTAIGAHGQVFDRHGDYRRAVNARLFSMPEEQYASLVDTLLHLRRPQLSKTLELDQLSRFLSESLPPLDARVVGPIAEGFERLDRHRSDLEALAATLEKLRGFDAVYREYARAVAKGRAQDLARAESGYQRARGEARDRAAERDALLERRGALERALDELLLRERGLAERIRALEASDAYRAAKDLDDAERAERRAEEQAEDAARRSREDDGLRDEASARRGESAHEAGDRAAEADRARAVAIERARDAALEGQHAAVDEVARAGDAARAADVLRAIRAARDQAIARLRDLFRDLARAAEAHRRAEERARDLESDAEAARDALGASEREADEAIEAWLAAAEAWSQALAILPRAAVPASEPDGAPVDPVRFRAAVSEAAEPVRRALAEERAGARARRDAIRAEHEGLREERDLLARAPHPTPPAPAWRSARAPDRPGAPLYLLCGFAPGAAGGEAGIEAALEASGLLDAWIEPGGTILDPRTEDAILRTSPAPGRTLADVLTPVAAGGVTEDRIRAALGSIGFAAAGESPEGTAWICADGRWRLGPLHGAWTKDAPAYVGATARERERARRIADLEARMGALAQSAEALEAQAREAEGRLDALARELASVPAGAEVDAARARVTALAEAHEKVRARHAEAEKTAAEADAARERAASALDRAAAEAGLRAFSRDPDGLAERSRAYGEAGDALLLAVRGLSRARAAVERDMRAAEEAEARVGRSREAARSAAGEAAAAQGRAAALREASGKERDEVLAALGVLRSEDAAVHREKEAGERERRGLDERVGESRKAAEQAEALVAARDEERKLAAGAFRALGESGLLAAAGFPPADGGKGHARPEPVEGPADSSAGSVRPELVEGRSGSPASWSFTSTLELARKVDAAVECGATQEEREKAEDRLIRRQNDLALQLPPGMRILPSRAGEVLSYEFTWNGRTRPAAEVVAEMEAEVAARTELLGDEEAQLLEGFLSGEAHDHLASRIREARALVDRMNEALEERTTAAGAQVRLAWELDDAGGLADAREAVPYFLRAGHLLTEGNRGALRAFLQRRLAEARDGEGDRSLQERLLDVLDYRSWHRFQVEHRTPGQQWAKLTKKAHAAGSGGKKAVMLHLPLFAAAAAFYDSADPAAPRIIALDEAFAGIDRPTRGKLMGLLAEFDLDFIMTSFEEWGFYEELDGLSTYHLSREPGHRGVHAEWFVWDGRERVLVEES
jgi:uncharacterized protein (TIGR02680 family)